MLRRRSSRAAPPRAFFAAALLSGVVACSCGRDERPSPSPAPTQDQPRAAADTPAPSDPKLPREPRGPIDPAKAGTITGVVRFEGTPPARKPLSIGGTGGCPDHPTPPLSEDVVAVDGKLANVFVWIKDGLEGWDVPSAKDESVSMDQRGCLYLPHVLGLRTGQKLLILNSDPDTTHNVNIRSRSNESKNPIQPPNGAPIEWRPTKRELGVPFECNLHPWMKAFVCVVDHPWFAVSGTDGAFSLAGVPPGEHVLESWHEKYGKKTAKVRLDPGGSAEATFAYRAP